MTAEEFLNVIHPSNMLRITKDGEEVFSGYFALLHGNEVHEQIKNETVKEFVAVPEIRHKEWKDRQLMPPLHPELLPQYKFSDMQITLYYEIRL